MGKALDATQYIHQGVWVDWSKGRIHGWALTPSSTNATLLTNLLALFVTTTGSQCWTLVRITLHQFRTLSCHAGRHDDKIYSKEQVVLRNSTPASTAAQLLLTVHWASRKDDQKASLQITPLVALAVFAATFFVVAGAFSNIVTSTGSHVLPRSPFYGFWNQTYLKIAGPGLNTGSIKTLQISNEFNELEERDVELSLQYAQACYLNQSSGSSNCDIFKFRMLGLISLSSLHCPFDAESADQTSKPSPSTQA